MGKLLDALRGVAMPEQKKTQMVYLDSEFESLKEERDALKKENLELRAELEPLRKTKERLEERLKEYTSKKEKNVVHQELDEIQKLLIHALARLREQWRTSESLAKAVRELEADKQMTVMKVEVYLERLAELGLVERILEPGPKKWQLTKRGKEYAVLHGLDK